MQDPLPFEEKPTAELPPRRCQHQVSPIPCAHPSCPAGVRGKRLRLVLSRDDGSKYAAFFRRRLAVGPADVRFEWTPA